MIPTILSHPCSSATRWTTAQWPVTQLHAGLTQTQKWSEDHSTWNVCIQYVMRYYPTATALLNSFWLQRCNQANMAKEVWATDRVRHFRASPFFSHIGSRK